MVKKRIRWSANLAYAVGLIATDGCLSNDGRHITLVSKDIEQLKNFKSALGLKVKIGNHSSGWTAKNHSNKYYRVQFGGIQLYRFLVKIGLTPHKSATIGVLKIPDRYFAHYFRGSLDGDGCTYSYWDPRWKSSFQFYTCLVSLSKVHIAWVQKKVELLFDIKGSIRKNSLRSGNNIYRLEFAKRSSIELMKYLYPRNKKIIFLERKKFKIDKALSIIGRA